MFTFGCKFKIKTWTSSNDMKSFEKSEKYNSSMTTSPKSNR